jgi:saccharopine dehydrogenase-like NADP-dependent oxidoreductase
MESNKTKQILILGSGMMVEPLIDYLLRSPDNRITIGTNMISSAQMIIEKKNNTKLNAQELDVVQDESTLRALIRKSNLVVSYIPAFLHEIVAKACLAEKVNMITTSYVSDALKNLDSKVKEAGLLFMNEIGLDPGIDHLITHKVINEANQRGEKIIHYESWCGALCSPEFLNNPLLYKFTWAPKSALLALKNEANQFVNNKKLNLPSNDLLLNTTDKQFHACFNLEGYFNRDSLTYKELYNLKDAETVIRGTIRFKGFAFVFQCFKHLGMFNDKKIEPSIENWRNYFYLCVLNDNNNKEEILRMQKEYIKKTPEVEFFITEGKDHHLFKAEITFYYELSLLALSKFSQDYISKSGFADLFKKIYSSLKYLELYEDNNKVI